MSLPELPGTPRRRNHLVAYLVSIRLLCTTQRRPSKHRAPG
jgi:hypothetical protein